MRAGVLLDLVDGPDQRQLPVEDVASPHGAIPRDWSRADVALQGSQVGGLLKGHGRGASRRRGSRRSRSRRKSKKVGGQELEAAEGTTVGGRWSMVQRCRQDGQSSRGKDGRRVDGEDGSGNGINVAGETTDRLQSFANEWPRKAQSSLGHKMPRQHRARLSADGTRIR